MKSKQIFLCIISLLLTSLLPAKVYADQSRQSMGSNNKNSPQIIGHGNRVCNNCNFYNSEAPQPPNQQNIPRTTTPPSADGQEDKFISIVKMPSPPTQSLLE